VKPKPRRKQGKKVLYISLGNNFLDVSPKARATRARINKQDGIKLKITSTTKETINKMRRQPMEQEKIVANYLHDS